MKFLERSFVENESYRPRPSVHWNEESGLLIIATPWGQKTSQDDLISKLSDYISSSKLDQELTTPFAALQNYDKAANSIRTALLLANEYIYKSKNKNEYTSGFEILVGVAKQSQFYFATVGHPHVLLSKKEKNILPLFMDLDHSLNLSKKKLMPALPDKLLGINSQVDFQVHNFKYHPGDQLILMSKSWIPKEFFSLSKKQRNFEDYAKELTKDDQQPFWLGVMEF
jgi:hypothetical protein